MPYSSPEILQLEAIRDWMATLTVWQTWVGSMDATTLKARVVWPLKSAPSLPVCVLSLGKSRSLNFSGAAGGSNFQPSGEIRLYVYAADTDTDNPQAGYSDFVDLFCRLRDEMADKAHTAPIYLNSFELSDPPVIHSSWVNTEDDDESEGLAAWWQGELTLRWGAER